MANSGSYLCSQLDNILTGLMDAKNGGAERDVLRKDLLSISTSFGDEDRLPAAISLAAALPALRDYGAAWISARMLKDIAKGGGDAAEVSFVALTAFIGNTRDAGTRYMTADLLTAIALSDHSYADAAARAIVSALKGESDHYAQSSMRNALMKIGNNCGEAAAGVVLDGFSALLAGKEAGAETVRIVKSISELGITYGALAKTAAETLQEHVQKGVGDQVLARVLANEIANLAFANPGSVNSAIKTLSKAFEAAAKHEQQVSYSNALGFIAVDHPVAVLTSLNETLGKNLSDGHNRMAILTVAALAQEEPGTAKLCAKILASHLPRETSGFNRRHIAASLLECTRNGAETGAAVTAINQALDVEADVDTRKEFIDTMRRMGYQRPFTGGVVEFRQR